MRPHRSRGYWVEGGGGSDHIGVGGIGVKGVGDGTASAESRGWARERRRAPPAHDPTDSASARPPTRRALA